LTLKGIDLPCSESLKYFLSNKVEAVDFDNLILDKFSQLDDFDIISALKSWQNNDDFILSSLSKMIINRDLLKIKFNSEKFSKEEIANYIDLFSQANGISNQDAAYFVFKGKIKNQAYSIEAEPIRILKKDKTIEDVMLASDQLNLKALSKPVTKYYICFPKQLAE
jgi:HD superfamily phosphohydrolase